MTIIDRNLMPDEKVIFRTKKHPIVFLVPCIFLLCSMIFCLDLPFVNTINHAIDNFTMTTFLHDIHRMPALIFLLLAIYSGITPYLLYATSDYVVTNKRVVMRHGFFSRYVSDTRLTSISHVTMDQGPLGQMLNYGNITINGFGGNRDYFTQIASPNEFQKNVNVQLSSPAVLNNR